jgi:DNA modification methylase
MDNKVNVSYANDTTYKNKIYNLDCLKYLDDLSKEEKQIDTIILDPPYFNVVNEKWDNQWKSIDDYLDWIENIIKKLDAVSKYNCSLWLFGFPYQLSFIIPIVEKYGFKEFTLENLYINNLINQSARVKILGNGVLKANIPFRVNAISEKAKGAIEAAGGTVEIVK